MSHMGNDAIEKWEQLSALPKDLTCKDGRRFLIRKWRPNLSVGDVVFVEIEAIIDLPESEDSSNDRSE